MDSLPHSSLESIPVMEESTSKVYIQFSSGVIFVLFNGVAMAWGRAATVLAAAALVLAPAIGLAAAAKQRPPAISLSFNKIHGFTPAEADPRLAAIFAGRGASIADYSFTPAAAAKGRPGQVRVAIRARGAPTPARPVEVAVASPISNLSPAQYDIGVAAGWKRFAVSGGISRTSSPDPIIGTRETTVVGVSYNLKKFTGRVSVGGERNNSRIAQLIRPDSVSVDLGGSYNVSRNIAVTGGVRYKIERDQIPALDKDQRDSKAVYVGTAFRF